jgi:hypothetical protein
MADFKLGTSFPYEGFVQNTVYEFFTRQGYKVTIDTNNRHPDLTCTKGSDTWVIEAKGKTSDIGLDFNTGLGQIMKRISDPNNKYAMAVPAIPQFERQCGMISPWVRERVGLYWVFVYENGTVRIDSPFKY